MYRGRLIAYSLGNFVFGSESERTNTSMILLTTFQGKTLVRVEAVPLDINNYRVKYRPHVLTGKAAVLALFLPLILSSGGNSGSQATTLVMIATDAEVMPSPVEQRA